MLDRIEQVKNDALAALANIKDAQTLQDFRARFLGDKGAVKELMGLLKQVPGDQKRAVGQATNELRAQLEKSFEELKAKLTASGAPGSGAAASGANPGVPGIDITEPAPPPRLGRTHIITQTIDGILEVFGRMGFDVATGPEIEDEFHNFIALNIPESHPARDPLDNFYLRREGAGQRVQGPAGKNPNPRPETQDSGRATRPALEMLRSQTSTIQIRVMEKTQPPIRVVATGRVYRPDEHDATHFSMFHQIEGLYVDRGVSMVDLKSTLLQFVHAYFGADAKVRLRPSFFPFTEPSAEMDVWMNLGGKWQWKEIGGCGMVDPNVFKAVGYDPEEWTGFAFGLGIERLAMRKYGISDIRWLFENDVRFLRQF